MERQAVPNFTLDYLMWSPPNSRPPFLSPTFSHSVTLCDSLYKLNTITSAWQPLAHIFHNPQFPPGMDIKAFQWWLNKGLYRIGHYFNSKWPLKLSHCVNKLEMPPSDKFRFFQFSHFLNSIRIHKPNPLRVTLYELWCSKVMDMRGGIFLIYSTLAEPLEKTPYMLSWERDLEIDWDIGTHGILASLDPLKGFITSS